MKLRNFLLILVLSLTGCDILARQSTLPIDVSETFQLDEGQLPLGWVLHPPFVESDWGTINHFRTHMVKGNLDDLDRLSGSFALLIYDDTSTATDAYARYESSAYDVNVSSPNSWTNDTTFNIYAQNADQSMLKCKIDNWIDQYGCAYWAQYGACIVEIYAPIGEEAMESNDYEIIINYVDANIISDKYCYPDG